MKQLQSIGWGLALGLATLLGAPGVTQAASSLLTVSATVLDKAACSVSGDHASTRTGLACHGSPLKAPMRVGYAIGRYETAANGAFRLTLATAEQSHTLSLAATGTPKNPRQSLDISGFGPAKALRRIAANGGADALILTITP